MWFVTGKTAISIHVRKLHVKHRADITYECKPRRGEDVNRMRCEWSDNNTQPCPICVMQRAPEFCLTFARVAISGIDECVKCEARGVTRFHGGVNKFARPAGLTVTKQLQFRAVVETADIGKLATADANCNRYRGEFPRRRPSRERYLFRSFLTRVYSLVVNKRNGDDPRLVGAPGLTKIWYPTPRDDSRRSIAGLLHQNRRPPSHEVSPWYCCRLFT